MMSEIQSIIRLIFFQVSDLTFVASNKILFLLLNTGDHDGLKSL